MAFTAFTKIEKNETEIEVDGKTIHIFINEIESNIEMDQTPEFKDPKEDPSDPGYEILTADITIDGKTVTYREFVEDGVLLTDGAETDQDPDFDELIEDIDCLYDIEMAINRCLDCQYIVKLYTDNQIKDNLLYGDLMVELNDLYFEHHCPQEFDDDEERRTTTGNEKESFWALSDDVSVLPDEDDLYRAKAGGEWLDEVNKGLKIKGNGGIESVYTSDEWDKFVMEAEERLADFHNEAYEKLLRILP